MILKLKHATAHSLLIQSALAWLSFAASDAFAEGAPNATTLPAEDIMPYTAVVSFGEDGAFKTISWAFSITTEAPTDVTATAATVQGDVTTLGENALVWFDIGTTTNYEVHTPGRTVPPFDSGRVSGSYGLVRGQTYHYRFVGSNSFGIVYGNDVAFTTPTANDRCSEAYDIGPFPFSHTQSTTDATSDGDPVLPGNASVDKGVWFKTTLSSGGILIVDTAGSSFDTVLAIYCGTCGALTNVACNDDAGIRLLWSSN